MVRPFPLGVQGYLVNLDVFDGFSRSVLDSKVVTERGLSMLLKETFVCLNSNLEIVGHILSEWPKVAREDGAEPSGGIC